MNSDFGAPVFGPARFLPPGKARSASPPCVVTGRLALPLTFCGLLSAGLLSVSTPAAEWRQADGYRVAALSISNQHTAPKPGFTRISPGQSGVLFTNSVSPLLSVNNQILLNGAGVALGDVDGDGRCDIFLCGSERPSALYRNAGNWQFTDITTSAGVACFGQFTTGAALVDVDGDRDLDLVINGIGVGTRLFRNDGRGHFAEDNQAGLTRTYGATSMALADLDADGDLDLYVCNYRTSTMRDEPNPPRLTARRVGDEVVITPEDQFWGFIRSDGTVEAVEKGEPDILYLNNGRGGFKAVPWNKGAFSDASGRALKSAPADWGLSVMLRDFDGDGTPDIYVCNDFTHSPDRLWFNDGRGKFRAAPPAAWRNRPSSSMGIDAADMNRDGHDDFLVVEMLSRDHVRRQRQRGNALKPEWNWPIGDPNYQPELLRNTLHLARGDGTFAEIAQLAGLAATEWSWAVAFVDVDLDGWEDLLITTGSRHDQMDSDMIEASTGSPASSTQARGLREYPSLELPNLAFRNRRDLTFEEVGAAWGFDATGISQGMALGDLDDDGDLDVVVNNLNREAWLYRNDSAAPRLAVRLQGQPPNTHGIGARIQVTGGPVTQTQTLMAGGRYLSSDEAIRVFAAGDATRVFGITVFWPSGRRSEVRQAAANQLYEIVEPATATPAPKPKQPVPVPHFEDRSALLRHTHVDEPFDDLARQPLLFHRLSQLGPGVAWFDLDGDGWDDLLIGGGKGGRLAAFQNDGRGGWNRMTNAPFEQVVGRDQTSVLGWITQDGRRRLLAGSSSYEGSGASNPPLQEYDLASSTVADSSVRTASSSGPLAMADIDADGDLDLFVGGRVIPSRYPEPAGSLLLRNDRDQFHAVDAAGKQFAALGLVTSALFNDLDGDGDPDLVVGCEWDSLRVFLNQGGLFTEATQALGLGGFKGFWNSLATGDFDADGRLDLVAANWGRNTRFLASREQPWRVYYGDFDSNQTLDLVEAYFAPTLRKIVPWRPRDAMVKAMPFVGAKFTTFRAYANAGVEEVVGDGFPQARQLQITTLDTMLFLNRGARFEAHPLPAPAQFAPVFGIAVADFDGDGNEDLVLAQNFFDTEIETSRSDAGRGLWLRGDGKGGIEPVAGQESGLQIYGEQRGLAVADYDGDGRVDLAVGQNRGPTQLLRNQGARPGLRVRLLGSTGNPAAVGATLRLKFGERFGPARAVTSGSGYWSQDSCVQVLATPTPPSEIWIRWPAGRITTSPVPSGAQEISVALSGEVKRVR